MPIEVGSAEMLTCPVCEQQTDSLKQFRVLRTIIAIPIGAVFSSAVVQSCPQCMRAFIWRRCLVNGLTTWVVGYLVLVPYTLAVTLATFQKGHSWPIRRGITPEMQVSRTWAHESSRFEKALAILSVSLCLLPGIGILVSWCVLWRLRRCTGWVHKTAEMASIAAVLVTITAFGMYFRPSRRPHG